MISTDLCSRDVIILISRFFIILLKPVTQKIRFPVVIISSIWIIGVNFFGWIKRRIICYIPVLYTIHWTKCSLCLKKLTLGFLECFKVYPKQQWQTLRIYNTCWNEYLTYFIANLVSVSKTSLRSISPCFIIKTSRHSC